VTDKQVQTWTLTVDGVAHRVEGRGGLRHFVRWFADDELVAQKGSAGGKLRLDGDAHGTLEVRYGALGAPRRATLGGLDLDPEPGSAAAGFEERVRARPHLYSAVMTAGGVARVVVPILLSVLALRFALSFDWPDWDLPDLPWPDLPSPNLPHIPFPDVTLPGWLRWILEKDHYVGPILVAFVLARAEVRRRRKQDELRAQRARQSNAKRD
jgi:hypothetical protein